MIAWLNRFNIWLAMGGQMNENAVSNGMIILSACVMIVLAVIFFNKKIKSKFF